MSAQGINAAMRAIMAKVRADFPFLLAGMLPVSGQAQGPASTGSRQAPAGQTDCPASPRKEP